MNSREENVCKKEMHHFILLIANIFLSISATTNLKLAIYHDEDASLFITTAYLLNTSSFSLLPFILRRLPLGISHVTLSSGTTILGFCIGYFVFNEAIKLRQVMCVILILAGVTGLHLL